MKPLIGLALSSLALSLLAACGSAPPSTPSMPATPDALADYPPLSAATAPGASPAARAFAASLKRGVNFGNMLDAPSEGAWGLRVDMNEKGSSRSKKPAKKKATRKPKRG